MKKMPLNPNNFKDFTIRNKSQLFTWKQDLDLVAFGLLCHFFSIVTSEILANLIMHKGPVFCNCFTREDTGMKLV